MKTYYCWKCGEEQPFLEESEWRLFAPHLNRTVNAIKEYRKEHGVGLKEAKTAVEDSTVAAFREITGYTLPDWSAAYHHRLADKGPECPNCGQLFRTPRAKFCANCGFGF